MEKITYLDHSGFAVTASTVILVFDYYRDPSHALHKVLDENPGKPVVFLVSHRHQDHFNPEIFHLAQDHPRLYVISNDIPSQYAPDNISIAWASRGDHLTDLLGDINVKVFGSTDLGVSYLVDLPSDDEKRFSVFHAGDFNLWHWQDESTPEEVRKAYNRFACVMESIMRDVKSIDLAFFPVDPRLGTEYSQGARLFLENLNVRYFVPMHFWGDYKAACDFIDYTPDNTESFCLHVPGESVLLTPSHALREP